MMLALQQVKKTHLETTYIVLLSDAMTLFIRRWKPVSIADFRQRFFFIFRILPAN